MTNSRARAPRQSPSSCVIGVDGGAHQAGVGVEDHGHRDRRDEILHRPLARNASRNCPDSIAGMIFGAIPPPT